jgi:hypothetical protein
MADGTITGIWEAQQAQQAQAMTGGVGPVGSHLVWLFSS